MSKLTTCLWFDGVAEEAAAFYMSLFPNSRITGTPSRYPEGSPQAGRVMTVQFELDGVAFVGLNGGPMFKFNEAISFQIACADQAEVDRYWGALTGDGGAESMCGWCRDRFGVAWQVIPRRLSELLSGSDTGAVQRTAAAMMTMRKIDVAALEAAAAGGAPVPPDALRRMGRD